MRKFQRKEMRELRTRRKNIVERGVAGVDRF